MRNDTTNDIAYIRSLFVSEDEQMIKIKNSAPIHLAHMQLAPEEAKLIYILLKMAKVKRVLEIGTFVGYSTLWIARAVDYVLSIEKSTEHYDIASRNLKHLPQSSKIKLVNANANEFLATHYNQYDAVFIDADKSSYINYLDHVVRLLPSGGLIIADNTFLFGAVHDDSINVTENLREVMRKFNKRLSDERIFEAIMIPNQHGLSIAIKK